MPFKRIFGRLSGKPEQRRNALRVRFQALAKIEGKPLVLSVRDISTSGIALTGEVRDFRLGMTVSFSIFRGRSLLLGPIQAEVARVDAGLVGLKYVTVPRGQFQTLQDIVARERDRLDIASRSA